MIVDASALLAVLFNEPDGQSIGDFMAGEASELLIAPFNYLEAAVRVDRLHSQEQSLEFDRLIETLNIVVSPTTKEQAKLARQAYATFGKGNHAAKLNLGDCFAYALSKARGEPLLFKGNDFRQTDVEAAL